MTSSWTVIEKRIKIMGKRIQEITEPVIWEFWWDIHDYGMERKIMGNNVKWKENGK